MRNIDNCFIGKYKMSSFNPESGVLPARRLPNFLQNNNIKYIRFCQYFYLIFAILAILLIIFCKPPIFKESGELLCKK
jgi:hypothetical protein